MNKWWLSITVALLLSACASNGNGNAADDSLSDLVVSAPQPMNVRYQLEIAKLTEILTSYHSEEIDNQQLAEFWFRRAALYDALGLSILARFDFNMALEFNPGMADAYNYLGIHDTQNQQFDYAFEAFEAAIELDPEHPYAYLNRGITAYYDNRMALAIDDLQRHFNADPSDPYRSLWLFFAEQHSDDKAARIALAQRRLSHATSEWGWVLNDLMLGVVTERRFLQQYLGANLAADETMAERLCEAYFYLGKLKQLEGNNERALVYFQLALSTNVFTFLEHRYAGLEIERSQQILELSRNPQ
ncbi:MAG: Lipoprotein NlpI [Pseudidiomarina mangrovi]|nr:MAG: Lipoprotein NlpI [Pseudidiomarina mangrovi]